MLLTNLAALVPPLQKLNPAPFIRLVILDVWPDTTQLYQPVNLLICESFGLQVFTVEWTSVSRKQSDHNARSVVLQAVSRSTEAWSDA